MRTVLLITLLLSVSASQAQRFLPGSFVDYGYRGNQLNNIHLSDSTTEKKWFVSKHSGITTSFTFFKGGSATVVSAPMQIQLNRKLNNNLFAFAGVSVAPAYVNFNQSFMTTDFNKANNNSMFFKSGNLGLYSRAELGLQYVNDERTFSISGSIGVERNSYSTPFYNQMNNIRSTPVLSMDR